MGLLSAIGADGNHSKNFRFTRVNLNMLPRETTLKKTVYLVNHRNSSFSTLVLRFVVLNDNNTVQQCYMCSVKRTGILSVTNGGRVQFIKLQPSCFYKEFISQIIFR